MSQGPKVSLFLPFISFPFRDTERSKLTWCCWLAVVSFCTNNGRVPFVICHIYIHLFHDVELVESCTTAISRLGWMMMMTLSFSTANLLFIELQMKCQCSVESLRWTSGPSTSNHVDDSEGVWRHSERSSRNESTDERLAVLPDWLVFPGGFHRHGPPARFSPAMSRPVNEQQPSGGRETPCLKEENHHLH